MWRRHLARCGNDDFLRAGGDVLFGRFFRAKDAGAFEDDIDTEFSPGQAAGSRSA